jgi:DNA-binding NarL/FixJ family response regulator
VCFLETSQYLDALVIDEDLQRTALAQREQALAEVGGTLDLSEEEVRILRMLAMAATTHEIEDEFCMSQRTMERHLGVLFRKLAVRTRSEAVKRAHDLGV